MDTDKILEFLQKIVDQLGPLGVKAYQIVGARVAAEAIIGLTAALVGLTITLILLVRSWKNYHMAKSYDEKEAWGWTFVCTAVIGSIIVVPLIYLNALTLFSLEYSTIERLINLAPKP